MAERASSKKTGCTLQGYDDKITWIDTWVLIEASAVVIKMWGSQ